MEKKRGRHDKDLKNFHPQEKQEEKILNEPAYPYRFYDVVIVILSGLSGGLKKASSDLRGQVVNSVD